MSTELESIPFDHYQRYAATAALVNALDMSASSVLEVGANRQRLLAKFLPHSRLIFSDLFEQADAEDFVQADASALPFGDGQFEGVVALDVIEHMPVHLRAKAVAEMGRTATRIVIIACPLDQPWVHLAERDANEVWRKYFAEDYPWLEEHKEFGLVDGDEIEQALIDSGYMVLRFGQGDASIWSGLMSAHFVKEAIAEMRPIVASADRLYNHSVFAGDRSDSSYRGYFVAVRNKGDLDCIQRSPVLTAKPDDAAVALLSSLGSSLQPIADRIRAAEGEWQLAAKRVEESEARLSAAATEWGRTAELLRQSEGKQLYVSEQWRQTAESLREVEARLAVASAESERSRQELLTSETRLVASEKRCDAAFENMKVLEDRHEALLRWVIAGVVTAVVVLAVVLFCNLMPPSVPQGLK